MIPINLVSFINKLKSATEEESIRWVQVGVSGEVFRCSERQYDLFFTRKYDDTLQGHTFSFAIGGRAEVDFQVDRPDDVDSETMRNLFSAVQINAGGLSDITDEFFRPPEALTQ